MKPYAHILFYTLFVMGLGVALPQPAAANPGAWVLPEGSGQIIHTFSHYTSGHRFDNQGNKTAQATYQKQEYNPYIEYGLLSHTTIGANLFLTRADDSADSNYGLGDAEFFSRTRVWNNDRAVISLQPMVKIPSLYARRNIPKIGSDHLDIGLSVLGGLNFTTFGCTQHAELELGQRTRFGAPENQYIANATMGTQVTENTQILLQSFNTLRAKKPRVATFTQSSADDYSLSKAQISAVYQLNATVALQGGGFYHVAGQNVGNGIGAMVGIWTKF